MKIIHYTLLSLALCTAVSDLYAPMLSQEIADREQKRKKKKVKLKDRDGNTISTMSYEDLKKNKEALLGSGDEYTAAKYLEEMLRICEDHAEKQVLMLELADLWYTHKNYQLAQKVYEDFEMLYPGSDKTGLALCREIECSYQQINSVDRDQTPTEDTLKLCERFMERKDAFSQEQVQKVQDIEQQARKRLFESEMYIANFYLKRSNFKSAQKRITTLEKRFLTLPLAIEPDILNFKIQLAHAQNDHMLALQLKIELAEKYPQESTAQPFVATLSDLKVQLAQLSQKQVLPSDKGMPATTSIA